MRNIWPMLVGLAVALVAMVAGQVAGNDAAESWQLAARYTARASFVFFLTAYCARPLHEIFGQGWSRYLLVRRRWVGLGFALSHVVHLGALVTYVRVSGTRPDLLTVLGGSVSYGLILAMAVTSNRAAQRRLGRGWKRLHSFAMHWLWLVFLFDYATRIAPADTRIVGLAGTSLALLAGCLRLAARAAAVVSGAKPDASITKEAAVHQTVTLACHEG